MAATDKPYKVKTNNELFYFDKETIAQLDLLQISPTEFNCIAAHRSVNVVITKADINNKKFTVLIGGEKFEVEIKDELDQILESMGFGAVVNKQITNIKAPMPGLVLEIAVTDGQRVNKNDKILILEAMKMENVIVIPADAIIKKILVVKGQAVDRGEVLVELSTAESS